MFRNMGNKIYVFSEYGEWDNEYKRVIVCSVFSNAAGIYYSRMYEGLWGCMKAYEEHLWSKGWRV